MNQSTKDQILEWICIGAQVPYQSLNLLNAQTKTIQQTLYRLKKDRLVQITGKDYYKEIRLNLKKKSTQDDTHEVIGYIKKALGQEYVDYYMTLTHNHHFHGHIENNKRVMRGAEILQILKRAGVIVLPWEKKVLSLKDDKQDVGYPPCYFTTKQLMDVRNTNQNQVSADEAIMNCTRVFGLLMSKGGAYCVYNLDIGVLQWSENGEMKTRNWLTKVVRNNWDMPDYMKVDRKTKELSCIPDAIYMIRNNETALKILKCINPRAKERAEVQGNKIRDKKQNTLSVYSKTHYIPLSEGGIFRLWLITQEDYQEHLKAGLLKGDFIYPRYNRFDGFVDDVTKVIIWFDGDLNRISYINELMRATQFHFLILCLPDQESLLHEYLCKPFTTQIFDEEDIIEIMSVQKQKGEIDAQLQG